MSDIPPLYAIAALVVTGIGAGFLNTAASSGSALTLTALIWLGMHPMMANGTNRVPVLVGLAFAVWRFHIAGTIPWREAGKFAAVAAVGGILGAYAASLLDDYRTEWVVAFAVAVALAVLCVNPSRWLSADRRISPVDTGPMVLFLTFLVGIWAGLIVLDSATYMLAVLVLGARYSIKEANAIKALAIAAASAPSMLIFGAQGDIAWGWAIPLSVGSVAGSMMGVRLSLSPHAAKWVFRILVMVLTLEVVRLFVMVLSQ